MNTEEALIFLVACVINGKKADPALLEDINHRYLMYLASDHQLDAITLTGLKLVGVKNEYSSPEKLYSIIYADKQFETERYKILGQLEKNKIWYMPLKGVILRDLYPKPFLRQMADNDILFDGERADDVFGLMTALGYELLSSEYKHHDHYIKPPFFSFEMHKALIDEGMMQPTLFAYYSDIRMRMIKDSGNQYGYHLSAEDFYIFMIAHEYKHYAWMGTGIRSLLDVYVYLKAYEGELNWEYISGEMSKLGLTDFERINRELALKIFTEGNIGQLTKKERKELQYFIHSGAYGRSENLYENEVKRVGKGRFILQKAFLSMDLIEKKYPFFYNHKVMIPFLPLYRMIYRRKNVINEIRRLLQI